MTVYLLVVGSLRNVVVLWWWDEFLLNQEVEVVWFSDVDLFMRFYEVCMVVSRFQLLVDRGGRYVELLSCCFECLWYSFGDRRLCKMFGEDSCYCFQLGVGQRQWFGSDRLRGSRVVGDLKWVFIAF